MSETRQFSVLYSATELTSRIEHIEKLYDFGNVDFDRNPITLGERVLVMKQRMRNTLKLTPPIPESPDSHTYIAEDGKMHVFLGTFYPHETNPKSVLRALSKPFTIDNLANDSHSDLYPPEKILDAIEKLEERTGQPISLALGQNVNLRIDRPQSAKNSPYIAELHIETPKSLQSKKSELFKVTRLLIRESATENNANGITKINQLFDGFLNPPTAQDISLGISASPIDIALHTELDLETLTWMNKNQVLIDTFLQSYRPDFEITNSSSHSLRYEYYYIIQNLQEVAEAIDLSVPLEENISDKLANLRQNRKIDMSISSHRLAVAEVISQLSECNKNVALQAQVLQEATTILNHHNLNLIRIDNLLELIDTFAIETIKTDELHEKVQRLFENESVTHQEINLLTLLAINRIAIVNTLGSNLKDNITKRSYANVKERNNRIATLLIPMFINQHIDTSNENNYGVDLLQTLEEILEKPFNNYSVAAIDELSEIDEISQRQKESLVTKSKNVRIKNQRLLVYINRAINLTDAPLNGQGSNLINGLDRSDTTDAFWYLVDELFDQKGSLRSLKLKKHDDDDRPGYYAEALQNSEARIANIVTMLKYFVGV